MIFLIAGVFETDGYISMPEQAVWPNPSMKMMMMMTFLICIQQKIHSFNSGFNSF